MSIISGVDPGEGLGGQETPKLHKDGKQVVCAHESMKHHVLVVNSYPEPPFPNPLSAPVYCVQSVKGIRHLPSRALDYFL